jgi:hypothetical protein
MADPEKIASDARASLVALAEQVHALHMAASAAKAEKRRRGRPVESASENQTKPWTALGISRATYYTMKRAKEL